MQNSKPLTDRQRDVLDMFVKSHREGTGSPSFREISQAMGFSSINGAVAHVSALVRKGYLRNSRPGHSRGYVLTFDPIQKASLVAGEYIPKGAMVVIREGKAYQAVIPPFIPPENQ